MAKENLVDRANKVLSPALTHATTLEVVKGQGVYLIGKDGKEYLDFAAGIAVTNTGHCHPRVVAAAKKQTGELIHACAGIVYYEANIALAEKLKEITPSGLDMTFFCQSGGEAIEGAIKLAKYVTKRPGLLAFRGSFHGRSFGALSLTFSKAKYREGYEPLLPLIHIAPYAYCYRCEESREKCGLKCLTQTEEVLKIANPKNVAAAVIEPVQGEGGYIVPPREFIQGIRKLCDKYKILLVFDEVQSGLGRTGRMFAAEHFGVTPDIMALAKGLASGFPIGAIIARQELMKAWPPGAHGSTLSGNPVCCAAGLATIKVIQEEKLVANSASLGSYFKGELEKLKEKYPVIGDVRGIGLMIGVEFVKPGTGSPGSPDPEIVKKIRELCLKDGLILLSCGTYDQVIRFVPPLIAEKKHIDQALKIFEGALKAAS